MSKGQEHLRDEGSKSQTMIAGATAGVVSRFCIAPLDVVKIRLQLQTRSHPQLNPGDKPPIYRSTLSTFRTILKHEGITAFWKGNIPAEFLYLGYGAVQFTTYRTTSSFLTSLTLPLPSSANSLISGSIAGVASTLATYPLDLLRTRFAAQGKQKVYTSLASGIANIYTQEGVKGFFRGLGAGMMSIVPNMGLFFLFYETLHPPLVDGHPDQRPKSSTHKILTSLIPGSAHASAGLLSSILSKTSIFPLDLIRKRLQVQGPTRQLYAHGPIMPRYDDGLGIRGTVKEILRREGVRGLYRGLGISLVKAAPSSAITMWVYEWVMEGLRRERET
ncbi:mitochondrial carrier [Stereum hirsutum FP-91666 SS1]|uniref:mitochondrial carrier n=1 Tax=Stereum hirsutum (strain FP-91666) TaxID=721885 RepID=UPI000444A1CB|nr:mitochondrial carrier [Stereum hirsutum FP-91666 SS1]EIM82114.1 mitochondrial carrier [Stereum hirsutum FP-91666 SS1]